VFFHRNTKPSRLDTAGRYRRAVPKAGILKMAIQSEERSVRRVMFQYEAG